MPLHRTDKFGNNRFYFDDETYKFYMSATTFCSMVLPENPYLTKWKQKLGEFEANRQAKLAAHYGTLLHILIENFLGVENYTPTMFESDVDKFLSENFLGEHRKNWIPRLKNDIIAFAQFAFEKELDPIHTERWMKHDITETGGIAGTLDLECYMKFNRKKQEALIDLKSGQKGFYDSHILQLELYKMIKGDPDLLLFNWAPKTWNKDKRPTYNFTNQTNTTMSEKLPHYIEICRADNTFNPTYREVYFAGGLSLGMEPEFAVRGLEDLMLESIN